MAGPKGGLRTPPSVMKAVTRWAGVTSKAGFQIRRSRWDHRSVPAPRLTSQGSLSSMGMSFPPGACVSKVLLGSAT